MSEWREKSELERRHYPAPYQDKFLMFLKFEKVEAFFMNNSA